MYKLGIVILFCQLKMGIKKLIDISKIMHLENDDWYI
jgi:hypothetical protein